MTAPKGRFLLALPGAFGPTGGIEAYSRLVVKGFHEIARERGGDCESHMLLDHGTHLDPRYLDPLLARPRGFAGSRPRFIAGTLERIVRFRPDLVVFGHVNFGPLALAARALRPTLPQWLLVYGVEVWSRMKPLKRLAARSVERSLSISDYSRVELVRHNGVDPRRVGLLPCALDPFWAASFADLGAGARIHPTRPLILTVARLAGDERHKGVDQVIRALPAIARALPGIRYAVVGDGTDRPRLEAIARDLGVADRVEFRGRVSADALAEAYAECSLFAMPSAQEGFGIVFLEAALFAKPSIGGNHGGSPEVIADGETGRLVQHDDTAGFARVAIEMLTDPERLRAMGQRAQRRLEERFTYPTLLRTLRAEVNLTLGGATPGATP